MSNRSIIYIDGFNLYYGALKGTSYKWLDLQSYFKRLRSGDDIQRISYFTARVNGNKGVDQATYLQALSTCPLVEIVYGLYKKKTVKCGVRPCGHNVKEFTTYEEKGTDVNIALQMVHDAYQGCCDRIVLVSGDSDLVPGLKLVRQVAPHITTHVYVPGSNPKRCAATQLRNAAHKNATLPNNLLSKSQFPKTFSDSSGTVITKPTGW